MPQIHLRSDRDHPINQIYGVVTINCAAGRINFKGTVADFLSYEACVSVKEQSEIAPN